MKLSSADMHKQANVKQESMVSLMSLLISATDDLGNAWPCLIAAPCTRAVSSVICSVVELEASALICMREAEAGGR